MQSFQLGSFVPHVAVRGGSIRSSSSSISSTSSTTTTTTTTTTIRCSSSSERNWTGEREGFYFVFNQYRRISTTTITNTTGNTVCATSPATLSQSQLENGSPTKRQMLEHKKTSSSSSINSSSMNSSSPTASATSNTTNIRAETMTANDVSAIITCNEALHIVLGDKAATYAPHILEILNVLFDYPWPDEVNPYRILTSSDIV
jgi:hypothetical protein